MSRPCGGCRHLDGELVGSGVAYCWRLLTWRHPEDPDCGRSERADGEDPPGKGWALQQRNA